jgi:LysR family hydrogen peroxide-inducible transcriptional activator
MRPTLRQFQYFVAVAEHDGFGAAAQALAVSQPSLSKQLAIMEDELGAPLFERTSRKVTLTPLGRLLLGRARIILEEVREFRAVAQGSVGLFGDRLSIGVLPSIGAYFMPIANRRLHELYPDLRLVVQEAATLTLLERLRDGKVDAVIGTPNNAPEFTSIPLFTETLWMCTASDDPLSRSHAPVTAADLKGRPLLALSPEFTLADVVERLASDVGAYVSRDYQGGSLDAVRQMAVMGAGIAILPSLYALAEAIRDPEFVVRRIDHPLAFHEIALHWRRASPLRADFEELAAKLVEVKQEIRRDRAEQFEK